MRQDYEKRGYIGIIGAAVVLIGMFLPFIDIWYEKISMFEALSMANSLYPLLALALLAVEAALNWNYHDGTASLIAMAVMAKYIHQCLFDTGYSFEESYRLLSTGFWVIALGIALLILCPCMLKTNEQIDDILTSKLGVTKK